MSSLLLLLHNGERFALVVPLERRARPRRLESYVINRLAVTVDDVNDAIRAARCKVSAIWMPAEDHWRTSVLRARDAEQGAHCCLLPLVCAVNRAGSVQWDGGPRDAPALLLALLLLWSRYAPLHL